MELNSKLNTDFTYNLNHSRYVMIIVTFIVIYSILNV